MIDLAPKEERILIAADFNGHVGEGDRGDESVMGKHGLRENCRRTDAGGFREKNEHDYRECILQEGRGTKDDVSERGEDAPKLTQTRKSIRHYARIL